MKVDSSQLTLSLVMDRARREFPDRRVVSRIDGTVVSQTYSQLFERVDRLCWALRGLGVAPGDRVGTIAWNHHRHLELYLAATLSGAVLHTINLRLPVDQAVDIAKHAGDSVVFIDSDLPEMIEAVTSGLQGSPAIVRMGTSEAGAAEVVDYEQMVSEQPGEPYPYPQLQENQPAATCYSSATTGRPKGVVYSHRALVLHSMMLAMKDTWALSESDSVLPVVPMFHVNAWGLPFAALWMGARLVLPGARPTARDLLSLLHREKVTFAAAVPTVWMDVLALLRTENRRLDTLRLVVSGGAPLPRTLLEEADELAVPMIHSYGMTEASPLALVGQPRSDAPVGRALIERRIRQGYVVPGLDYRVVDLSGANVPRDGRTSGELLLRGPWVAEEYQLDERSADAFVEGWYHTGDIVTVDSAGYVKVVDRANDVIKSGGEWISSVDLENALMDHPAVETAAVIGVPDTRWQERPRGFVVSSSEATSDELREFLAQQFPRFWIPDDIVFVSEIPLTSVGKFDKRRLREL
ncbi:long-chain fatty acid--CoA ligase [Nocardia nova]|uniref:long-chain fatty acid--CoA ligase n=1 Tax=Nocardia nova TaxID=37330 RepID=UPI0033D084AF